jgi:hypothetical chaperone protein
MKKSANPNLPLMYAVDFGTTNSLLAAADPARVFDPIPLDAEAVDPTVLRTLLYFPNMRTVYYGAEAIRQFTEHQGEGRLIRSIKKQLPVRSFLGTWIEDRPVNLEDLIGFFLQELRNRANDHFQRDVDSVLLGRPAKFSLDDGDDRFAQFRLERAARQAGFKHIEFCPEPVAAAFAFQDQLTEPKTVLVADFGGGTSDFTLLRMGQGAFHPSDVLALGGVPVAGDLLDGSIMRHRLSPHFGADVKYQIPFGSHVLTMPIHLMQKLCSPADVAFLGQKDVAEYLQKVKQWAKSDEDRAKMDRLFVLIQDQLGFYVFETIEKAKRHLSDQREARLDLDYPGMVVKESLSRNAFDELILKPTERIFSALDETVRQAGLTFSQVDLVCCTGGTAKVPYIREGLKQRFGEEKLKEYNFFHSVVRGLAERAKQILSEAK